MSRFSLPLEKHQAAALAVFVVVVLFEWGVDGGTRALLAAAVLAVPLLQILGYPLLALFGRLGFWEFFARDYHRPPPAIAFAFFPWLLLIVAALFLLFDWRLY